VIKIYSSLKTATYTSLKKATTPMTERKERRTLLPTDFMDPLSEMILSSAKTSSESQSNSGWKQN